MFIVLVSNAQKSEIGYGLGFSTYFGDLNSQELKSNLDQSHPAIQVFYNYYVNQYLNTRISLGQGKISGYDSKSSLKWQNERNLSFESKITELTGVAEYNVLGLNYIVNPYVFAGVNYFRFNPKTMYNGEWIDLQPLGTEGQGSSVHPDRNKYKLYDISLVFGGGIKFKVNKSIIISTEIGWRRTNTDYLDDVSDDYVNYYELSRTNGQLAAKLSDRTSEYFGSNEIIDRETGEKRGGAKSRDYYTMTFVNIVYTLNSGNPFGNTKNVKCPKF